MDKRTPSRLEELDYLNAVACLLVILIHVLSLGITRATPGTWQAFVIYLPWRLSAFVVPAFLFSGAVKMAMQSQSGRDKPYLPYMAGRFRKIYIPYVVWMILYYLYFLAIHYVKGTWGEFFKYLLVGNISSQFYYIVIVMQFYLLRPLWSALVRRVPWYIAVGCAVPVSFIMQKLGTVLELWGFVFPYADRVFPTYMLFWIIGLYAGKHYESLRAGLSRIRWAHLLSVGMILLYAMMCWTQYSTKRYIYDMDHFKLFADCLSILTLLSLCIAIAKSGLKIKGALRWIHKASFSVFLSHCLFLSAGTELFQRIGISGTGTLLVLRFAVCYTLPFLLFFAQDKAVGFVKGLKGKSA